MSKKPKFQSPTGMHDILPEEQPYFQKIYKEVENIASFYDFKKIDTPILEETQLFEKGTGLSTDIVQKEMYSFRTKGGDHLTLRPEGTPTVMRAFIQHGMFNLPQPVKLWYWGPFFRYEHSQAGRFREFRQFGFETLGETGAVIDVQTIQIFYNILRELHFKNLLVEINSIGDSQCRPYYKKLLVSYFKSRESALCPDCKRRLRENPLRILDCKEEKCQPVISQAPQMIDHLCEECHNHFKEVLEFLDEIELSYSLNSHLVRGLDYYTKTVFEISSQTPVGKNVGSLAAGGRYDTLSKLLGGKPMPGCGGAAGVERIVAILKEKNIKFAEPSSPKLFLAQLGNLAKRKSLKLLGDFRKQRIQVAESFGRDSLKAQLSRANKLGVKYTLILGQREALEGQILLRDMATGKQETVKLDRAVREIEKRIKN
jgi:histidyl-tRNA synthetase